MDEVKGKTEQINNKMEQLKVAQTQREVLMKQLKQSLAIEELWPGVFAGRARVVSVWDRKDGVTFTVKRVLPSGRVSEERVFPLNMVPECLQATMPVGLLLQVQEAARKYAVMQHLKGVRS